MNRKGKLTLLIVFWSILLLCTGCSTDRNTNKTSEQDHPCNGTGWYEVTAVTADSVTIEMHGTTGGAPPQEITTIHVGDLNTGSIIYDGEEYFFIDNTPLHF